MKTASFLLFALSWCCLHCTEAFTANRLTDFAARTGRFGGEVREGVSFTHRDISGDAILRVTADLLRDNPNSDPNIDSTARINALTELTAVNLIDAYYGSPSREQRSQYEDAIEEINEANEATDTGAEQTLAAAHFDSEQLEAGQKRLITLRGLTTSLILFEEYEEARMFAGSMLHTLQDFYSHTNWIEMGQEAPNSVLGERGQQLENIATQNIPTCADCVRNGSVGRALSVITNVSIGQVSDFYYRCNNNILTANRLTSGYYTGQRSDGSGGGPIPKPDGKCSHGGFGDPSSDLPATGGINKDSISLDWSPHANFHDTAASVAVQASIDILQAIRTAVDDDTKFAAFFNLDRLEASIAYVIDTTGSMGEDLPEIQATIRSIRAFLESYVENLGGNARIRFILVPFNDPDPGITIVTEDIDEFLNAIGNLRLAANGGGDCPEPSIGALIRAIRASERGSSIFVYTDADASDPGRLAEAQALIRETRVTVNYVLTGRCFKRKRSAEGSQFDTEQYNVKRHRMRWRRQTVDDLYTLIATTSGGQVLNIDENDISELSSLISFSLMQALTTIFYRMSSVAIGSFNFPVDESVSQVLIAVNGVGIGVTVTTPQGIDSGALGADVYLVSVNTFETYVAVVNVSDSSLYGEWQLIVTFSSGSYNVRITAVSDLDFTYSLFRLNPEADFGFVSFEGNPREGEILVLFIQLRGEFEGTLNEAILLGTDGDAIETLNITDIGDGGYANTFVTPNQPFQLQIVGNTSSGNFISRISTTGVEPTTEEIALFSFTSSLYCVVELANAEAEVIVQIEHGNLTADVQVTVETLNGGSATVDVDYRSTTCNLIFPSGSDPGTMRSCFIPILGDILVEADETITVEGSTATTVLPFTTTVVIIDLESTSPVWMPGLDSGRHRLKVRPRGCGRPRSGHKSLSVNFNV